MMRTHIFTRTDAAANGWTIIDDVTRLREWATGVLHGLPRPPVSECTIGSADTSAICLNDPSMRVSRLHASLIRNKTKWILRDEGSKNGVWADGSRRCEFTLAPGLEIGIGGICLIAESERSAALRGFLARLIGWQSDRTERVDHAFRSVRMAATRRIALVLSSAAA